MISSQPSKLFVWLGKVVTYCVMEILLLRSSNMNFSSLIEIRDPLKSTQPTFKAIFPCAWPPATQFQFSFCRGFFGRHSKGLATDMYAGPGDMKLAENGGRKIRLYRWQEWQKNMSEDKTSKSDGWLTAVNVCRILPQKPCRMGAF